MVTTRNTIDSAQARPALPVSRKVEQAACHRSITQEMAV